MLLKIMICICILLIIIWTVLTCVLKTGWHKLAMFLKIFAAVLICAATVVSVGLYRRQITVLQEELLEEEETLEENETIFQEEKREKL